MSKFYVKSNINLESTYQMKDGNYFGVYVILDLFDEYEEDTSFDVEGIRYFHSGNTYILLDESDVDKVFMTEDEYNKLSDEDKVLMNNLPILLVRSVK